MKSGKQAIGSMIAVTLAAAMEDGSIVNRNGSGLGVVGADAASVTVAGLAMGAGAIGDVIKVYQGPVALVNGTSGEAFAGTEKIGAVAYVIDAETVGKVGGTNKVAAGLFMGLTEEGLVLVDMSPAGIAAAQAAVPSAHIADASATATAPVALTYAAPAGGATQDAEARASLAQLAVDVGAIRTREGTVITELAAAVAKANAIIAALEAKSILAAS